MTQTKTKTRQAKQPANTGDSAAIDSLIALIMDAEHTEGAYAQLGKARTAKWLEVQEATRSILRDCTQVQLAKKIGKAERWIQYVKNWDSSKYVTPFTQGNERKRMGGGSGGKDLKRKDPRMKTKETDLLEKLILFSLEDGYEGENARHKAIALYDRSKHSVEVFPR